MCVPAYDTVRCQIIEQPEAAFLKAFNEGTIDVVIDSCDLWTIKQFIQEVLLLFYERHCMLKNIKIKLFLDSPWEQATFIYTEIEVFKHS